MWWRRLRWLLGLIAVCTIATCPIGWRACRNANRAREADQLLAYVTAQLAKIHAATNALPRTPAPLTPSQGACCKEDGGQCAGKPAQWQTPGWQAIGFSIDDPHRFSYEYEPTPDGGAIVRAVGDVDCDGVPAVIEVRLGRAKDGKGLTETWTRQNEME